MLGDAGLSKPEDLFDIAYFKANPRPFFSFAKKLWPGTHPPADTHRFIREIERHGKLLRNYTQNIDTLETVCGIDRVIQCHGSFSSATCTRFSHCGTRLPGESVRDAVMAGSLPFCPRCQADPPPSLVPARQPCESAVPAGTAECSGDAEQQRSDHPAPAAERTAARFGGPHSTSAKWDGSGGEPAPDAPAPVPSSAEPTDQAARVASNGAFRHSRAKVDEAFDRGVLKPDIVFFGEPLQDSFFDKINVDVVECDLLIVMGTSLAVAPVNGILDEVAADVPRILINREPVACDDLFDLQLLGNCDAICNALAERLGWSIGAGLPSPDRSVTDAAQSVDLEAPFACLRSSVCAHRWLFEGAVERSRRSSSPSASDSDGAGSGRLKIDGDGADDGADDLGDGADALPDDVQAEAAKCKKRAFDEVER
jgi:NAD-dependent histone deacetylase SIR2